MAMKEVPALKPHIVELLEHGKPIRGIAVRSPNDPHRQLHMLSTFQSMLCERLHDASSQLRPLQGEEGLEGFRSTHMKKWHPSLKGGNILGDLQGLVEAHKKKLAEEKVARPPSPPRETWVDEQAPAEKKRMLHEF